MSKPTPLEYDYFKITEKLNEILLYNKGVSEEHSTTIKGIIYGLENELRMHWIDDTLMSEGLPSTELIFNHYHIDPYK